MFTIITSTDYELSGLRKELSSLASGPRGRRSEARAQYTCPNLEVIGVGKEHAQATVRMMLKEQAAQPDSSAFNNDSGLLLLGVAGAVDPALNTGDLVLSSRYFRNSQISDLRRLDVSTGPTLIPDVAMWDLAVKACQAGGRNPLFTDSLTVDRVISSPEQKKSIVDAYPVGIVEMEDYWVAEVAAEFGVAFLSARVVLDTAKQALPLWLLGLSGSKQKAGLSLAARPWRIPTVVRLARQYPVVQESLTRFALNFLSEAAQTEIRGNGKKDSASLLSASLSASLEEAGDDTSQANQETLTASAFITVGV